MTDKQAEWLALALERGYERPFWARSNRALRTLVWLGLLERRYRILWTYWRPTQKAIDEYEVL